METESLWASGPDGFPVACPYGHLLGPGRVLVGWRPCRCSPATGGHRTYSCRACQALSDQRQTTCHQPPCTVPRKP
ncbi:hypothetical protein EDD29_8167 [Actinocorallia herbida]|uniref:Uncharacterized protein n=1 Tax=Actinocorallia herbida TaxID=58109 RepID=A0A3N1DAB6_9ACTN|nr:hypothetical protein [Actinocorallia herbida]ROO90440.1 hypothetical protein EDD29_8167 [Actinocorallia herbida]